MSVPHCTLARSFSWPLAGLAGALVLAPAARAATLEVCPSGCPYATVQAAVDAAVAGDEIRIRRGYHEGDVVIRDKRLTLKGAGASQTILRGTGTTSVVRLDCADPATTITISDLAIRGGSGGDGGFAGGGLLNVRCTASLKNSVVSNNTAFVGGGIANAQRSTLTVTGSTVTTNTATGITPDIGAGGGILNVGALILKASTVAHNAALGRGGGIANGVGGTLTVTGSTVASNTSAPDEIPWGDTGAGGGIWSGLNTTTTIVDSIVSNNAAIHPDPTESGYGGGIVSLNALTVRDSTVAYNTASADGGGVSIGLIEPPLNPLAVLTLRGSLVVGNRAGQGGGLFVGPFGTVDAAATTVANNTPNDCADDSGTTTC